MGSVFGWGVFGAVVCGALALDLGLFHRQTGEATIREAMAWTAFWIALALAFGAGIYIWSGSEAGSQFLAGYLVEKSLSLDNIFVFYLVFSHFHVPQSYQHKVLFWGILGALAMRFAFILAGIALIARFHWMIYLFGAVLLFAAVRMFTKKESGVRLEQNPVMRLARRMFSVTDTFEEDRFFVRRGERLLVTPLFIVLLVVETTDIVFAVDSIPAVLAVTSDPFIVYTSNVFAILGLRALYFVLAGMIRRFAYLHYGLGVILAFVGAKMIFTDAIGVPPAVTLAIIVTVLTVSILISLRATSRFLS